MTTKVKSRLNQLRKDKKITQIELAKETGINAIFLSKLENGKVERLPVSVLITLSNFFDKCPIEDLIYIDHKKE